MLGQQISASELNELKTKGFPEDSTIVDVRTPEEFASGAISGAINIPVDVIMDSVEKITNYKKAYFYCLSGSRSQLAIAELSTKKLPTELYNLTSGLLAWRKSGLPLQ